MSDELLVLLGLLGYSPMPGEPVSDKHWYFVYQKGEDLFIGKAGYGNTLYKESLLVVRDKRKNIETATFDNEEALIRYLSHE
ncbi:MAG: hypothetical protein HRU18_02655 [Pseudoalteromonas sp.]|uniref:hypothetical protein n=1 Tax=Pseudoalteromonas sp. TaxID=53249 RepID=UPI001DAC993C|nr:hypothetical protein [Pseudoalteromonas sp.]NRA77084.1 hypothetical protein [Pseudoalteromonas sp.]